MEKAGATMHAAVLHSAGDLRYETVPTPAPREDEALVAISANGLCGSDVHFYESGRLGPFVVDRPYIPGHEAVGVIVRSSASRSASASVAVGARVAIEPGIPCRRCSYCLRGLYNLCAEVRFLSAPPENGTFAEYAAVPADFCHPVPDVLSDEEAALVEPVCVGLHACNRADIRPGAPFAIVGAGPIGLVTMLVAFACGAGPAIVLDVVGSRLQKAVELGAAHGVDAADSESAAREVVDATNGEGVPFVFDTSGSSAACALAPRLAARAGVVTIVGWPEASRFPFPIELVIERELDVRGINRYRNTFPAALELMRSRRVDVRPLISHRFAFERVLDAFEFASKNRIETIKVIVAETPKTTPSGEADAHRNE